MTLQARPEVAFVLTLGRALHTYGTLSPTAAADRIEALVAGLLVANVLLPETTSLARGDRVRSTS